MTHARTLIAAVLFASGFGCAALAQTRIPQQRPPNMPAPENTIPEKVDPSDPPTTGSTRSNEPLSEKLEKSEGVIRPPENISPDMTVPAPVPNPGTTPVIPPPGSPGGSQAIQPK